MCHLPLNLPFFILLSSLLSGCEDVNIDHPAAEKTKESDNQTIESVQAAEPIDLNITTEMLESLDSLDETFLAPIEAPSTSLGVKKSASDINFSGKLHTDIEKEKYIDVIEGGEVSVEIKFK